MDESGKKYDFGKKNPWNQRSDENKLTFPAEKNISATKSVALEVLRTCSDKATRYPCWWKAEFTAPSLTWSNLNPDLRMSNFVAVRYAAYLMASQSLSLSKITSISIGLMSSIGIESGWNSATSFMANEVITMGVDDPGRLTVALGVLILWWEFVGDEWFGCEAIFEKEMFEKITNFVLIQAGETLASLSATGSFRLAREYLSLQLIKVAW